MFTPGPEAPQPDEAEWAAYYAAHDRFIDQARTAHAAWIREHPAPPEHPGGEADTAEQVSEGTA